ncbi:mechanosensitive ion channel family protein [Synechococcus sp. AH-551-G15]|nr:mechanosensitive ion channel family protein [Synechococcus sp. AH-551-G15]
MVPNTPRILKDTLFIIFSAVLIVLNLQQSKIDLVGIVTTSAVLTAVFGLAAQDPLKDLIGGLSLQLEQVIREGDWIEIGNQIGKVASISWRDTELSCRNGSRLVLPHSILNASTIRNFTSFGPHGNELLIGLDYNLAPHKAKTIMIQIARNHPLVLNNPPPVARIEEFEESTITYNWMAWHENYDERRVIRGELQEQLWYALNREGFSFPFPVRDVRLQKSAPMSKNNKLRKEQLQNQIVDLLERNEIFSILSKSQILQIADTSSVHCYGPGEIIVAEGEKGDSLFMLLNGQVSVRMRTDSSTDTEVAKLKDGDIFGEMTLFTGSPRIASVRSPSEVEVLEVHRPVIAGLIEQEPILLERLGKMISIRQTQLQKLQTAHPQYSRGDVMRRMQKLFSNLLA